MASIKIDQVTFPIEKIQAKLSVHGIYALPEEWKVTDEANPGLFTYVVRMSKFQIAKGKISPRELTDKQKRQQEQKNKKGGKKDSKNPEPNQEEQKIKKIEQERQKNRQQLFAKLSAQEQFYHTSEDIYRSPFLKFEQSQVEKYFNGNDCLLFEQRLLKDNGDWIYIYKVPAVSEQQLAKMRKTKPKTLNNINDLNPLVMRAWVNFQQLSASKQQTEIKQVRCKIQQVEKTAQTSEPNLQKTYIKVTFSLSQSVVKQNDSYSISSLINDPQKPKQVPLELKCLQQLKQQLSLAIESLAMEYSTMFWKEINMQQEQKNSLIFLNNKKGELSKRKEQFLYDFNVTGKYKILKDRVKKCIVHLCETKYKDFFKDMKSFNGVKCNNQDQIYSQIYNLLVSSYQETLYRIVCEKEQHLGQVLVLNNETLKQTKQGILTSYKQQTVIERVRRSIKQYEIIQDFQYGQETLRKYIEEYPQITQLKYQYGIYCLKYNLKSAKQVLPFIEQYLTKQKHTLSEEKKIQYMLILFNIGKENNLKGWIILRQVIDSQLRAVQGKSSEALCRWLILGSIILKDMGKSQLASKYKSFSSRQYQKVKNSVFNNNGEKQNSVQSGHKQSPNKNEVPSIITVASYAQLGSSDEMNIIYDELISFLNKYSTFDLIKTILTSKQSYQKGSQNSEEMSFQKALPQLNQLLVSNSQEAREKLLQISLKLYAKSNALGTAEQKNRVLEFVQKAYLLKIVHNNANNEDLKSLQAFLKKGLMTSNDPLCRLGYLYCQKGQFNNSRACLLKYLQKSPQYPQYLSGLSYKLLGICCLRLQRVAQAIQNFKHWNLCDSKNTKCWLYLALAFEKSNNFIIVNQCLTQYKKRSDQNDKQIEQIKILKQLNQNITKQGNQQNQYEKVLKQKLLSVLA